jgi:hypothetical protein
MGFFLPALLGVLTTSIAGELILGPTGVREMSHDEWLAVIGLGAVVAWVVGVFLLGINFQLIRAIEGYGSFNPLQWLKARKEARLTKILERISALEEKYHIWTLTVKETNCLTALQNVYATEFPARVSKVLPTDLGNRIAAFESYPLTMYGLDAVTFWDHLNILMPPEGKTSLEEAKSQFDFWLNLMFIAVVVPLAVSIMATISTDVDDIIPAAAAWAGGLLVLWGSYNAAKTSAMLWGDTVKAGFDLYVNEVVARFALPDSSRDRLEALSLAIGYRNPEHLAQARSRDAVSEPAPESSSGTSK